MNNLNEKDRKNIWHPFTPLVGNEPPILISSASGVYLHTADRRKIIDAVSSWWVNLHGHSHPYIAKAIAEQAATLEHVIFAGFTHEPAIKLSENLLSILPENQTKIFFSDNGSTAVEVAIKMGLQFWFNRGIQRKRIVALNGAYHGDTFGSMSIAERNLFTAPFNNHLFETDFLDFPSLIDEETLFQNFDNLLKGDDVAVFIFEPLVQGASGMRMYDAATLDKLIAIARKRNVLCIADEVFTGFGRTGKYFAVDHLKNKPDIIALSKGLTGGTVPLGVTSCSAKILEAFETSDFSKTFFHGHSFTANPVTCAAANASFDLLTAEQCQQQIAVITKLHETFVRKVGSHPHVKEARSLGTILAIELVSEGASGYTNELRKKIYPWFMNHDILLRPLGNTIYVLPPYVISKEELEYIYDKIELFLSERM